MIDKRVQKALKLQEEGHLAEAEELYRSVLSTKAKDFVSLFSLGVIMLGKGEPFTALDYIDRAIAVKPNFALAWYNRGFVLQELKRSDEALESYNQSFVLDSTNVDALINSGTILQDLGRNLKALELYEKVLILDPTNRKILNNKGLMFRDTKLYDRAIPTFKQLLALDPDFDYGQGAYCNAMQMACQWDHLGEGIRILMEKVAAGKRICGALELLAISDSPPAHLEVARLCGAQYQRQPQLWRGERYHHDKIRIAYISPDLQEHPVTHLLMGIIDHHDRSRFEIIAFSLGYDNNSQLRSRIAASFDRFIEVQHKSALEISELVRSMEIDIAVDLAGYTARSRSEIFAHRPAPIQVNYLGFPGTMGVEYMDYIIADRWVIPEADQHYFAEQVVYLPGSYLPTNNKVDVAGQVPTRQQYGLPATGFIYCSFNHSYKITPQIFEIWMNILSATPGSVLWLMKLNTFAEENLQKEAAKRGIEPQRLIFATRIPSIEEHVARYTLADLFLDTTPYNAHTTASDALSVGLPVLTCQGKAFPGRVAGSLLRTIGMPELIADSLPDYQLMAIEFARDPAKLERVKKDLIRKRAVSPLFDTARYCRYLEAAFTHMVQQQQNGESPAGFTVPGETVHESPATPLLNADELRQQALALQAEGMTQQAGALFRNLLEKHPSDIISLYSLGVICLNEGDPVASLGYFDQAAALNPAFPQTWFNRGVVLLRLLRPVEALASFNRVLEIDPNHVQARAHRDAVRGLKQS